MQNTWTWCGLGSPMKYESLLDLDCKVHELMWFGSPMKYQLLIDCKVHEVDVVWIHLWNTNKVKGCKVHEVDVVWTHLWNTNK